ncbi:ABC transporter substrate-binding protein [Bradyrhizobium japonicum]|uniref:ABC transporter substrate-binding protein n=1 Tax=Bradyrhizobium japonicum TaxID=375 RepID=UPI001E5124D7|nr:ABC transporter substrate-binding protein [Bradyrhizobium japonicum]MCD9825242.1 ABC transporter substrate-binding protein [Bradyrhizobium japonicum]MCD9898260.1 ABC transporter substrate-binding protein [Bradyrhizobium japonicum]MEB2671249.1 ABC transporter substrate-binding protein [Bradyrhizobium japonicum]WLB28521.1 ABC transporter substrate-binding protein [Bradyrhizobium japonicum]WRI90563.1 ABC transporter substrate-binding protein [Bradyrhizobium japonicum]
MAEQQSQASAVWALSGVDKSLPYAITFANFNGGPAVLEALISGAVDIGYIGEAPLPIAVGTGVKDLVAIAIYANPGSPENYYLVAQPDKGIKTVADLKGRTVAYPPGSGRHMVLAGILHANGLELGASSVKGVPLAGTEVAPSFASRSVDAAILLGGQYFRVGKPPIIADGRGHNWGVNVILTRKALLDDPAKAAAIADFVRRAVAFYNWQGANPDAWIRASYVKLEGLTFEQGKWLEDAAGHGAYYPIDAKSIQVFQQISDGLFATGALKQKIDIAPYVDGRFNAIIAWQNNADGVIPRPLEQPNTTTGRASP